MPLCLSPCLVVVEDDLQVMFALEDSTCSIVANVCFWVDVDNLPVSFVLEKQTWVLVSDHVVVGCPSRL